MVIIAIQLNIDPEMLFDPFYRDPGTTDRVSGSGLGLSIVKELTEKMDGQIIPTLTDEKIEIALFFKFENEPFSEEKKKQLSIPKLKRKRKK
ncbi:hypothetical protein B6I21_06350 [candidate division KSB1 bacterium 4572_119]|nr:MAG: hypothetical protein B6I21_06350 [candidate division KSB1 bacterium 4572_119]